MLRLDLRKTGNTIQLCLIWYGLLLLDSGFFFAGVGGVYSALQIILAMGLLVSSGVKLQLKSLLMLFALLFFVLVSSLLNGDSIRNVIVTCLEIFEAFCIASAFFGKHANEVRDSFRKILVTISCFSVITFFLSIIALGIFSFLPVFVAGNGIKTYFAGLSFVYAPRADYVARNPGIFWEPGAFQTYLILALIYEMFIRKERNKGVLILYSVALATTLSTTGIVCGILLWVLFAFAQKKLSRSALLLIVIVLLVTSVYTYSGHLSDSVKFSLITKLESLLGKTDESFVTVDTRVGSFVYGIRVFLENPLVGIGRNLTELKELARSDIASCTPINWFAQYGLFPGAIVVYGFFSATRLCAKSRLMRILLLCLVLMSVSTEAFNYAPTFIFIAFVGVMHLDSNKNSFTILR